MSDDENQFRYSREERLGQRRKLEGSPKKFKGLVKLFGGNPIVARFFVFYVVITVVVWVFFYDHNSKKSLKNQSLINNQYSGYYIQTKYIKNQNRSGLNVRICNQKLDTLNIQKILVSYLGSNLMQTNFNILLKKDEEEVIFFNIYDIITDIDKLSISVE